ncbi:MAG: butyrate kinase [Defluviitaleaceae bacterium]|nr:butyrate kinase [Defluviitaleaceae bacterium]
MYLILAINPGSTSTKIGLFENDNPIFKKTIRHTFEELLNFKDIPSQKDFRLNLVINSIEEHGFKIEDLNGVVGIGGLLPTIDTGGYIVNDDLKNWLENEKGGSHASNLGALIADLIAKKANCNSYIYDAVSAGDIPKIAKITGFKEIERKSLSHVLNSRAMCIEYAKKTGKKFEDLTIIVAHMGGGISLSLYEKGILKDSVGDDIGPFSPERSGGIPLMKFVNKFYDSGIPKEEIKKLIRGKGGLVSHLGTTNIIEIEENIKNDDKYSELVFSAMCYNIAKSIGALSTVTNGNIDSIILTGGIANSKFVTNFISEKVKFIANVVVMSGEHELEALARGLFRIISGKEKAKELKL